MIVIDARESGTSTGRYVDKLIEYLKNQPILTEKERLELEEDRSRLLGAGRAANTALSIDGKKMVREPVIQPTDWQEVLKARQEGNHAAFLSVLDDRGVLFRPGPVIGKAWLRKQQPDASKLTWFPSFVDVSEAGDLGYSTGPYEWRADAESKQVAHGHFVSIWGRRGGAWKLWVDMGSPHAAPAEEDPVFEPQNSKGAGMGQAAPPFSAEALQNLEKEFWNAVSARGTLPAYLAYLAADARFYRPGALPTTDLDAIRKALEKAKGATVWTCLGSAMAKSNDLGYVYGISERAMDLPQEPGATPIPVRKHFIFLHVWKRQPDGRWKVALDIENPLP